MAWQCETRSFLQWTPARQASRWLTLVGAVLLVFTIRAYGASADTLGAGDSIRVTVFQNPDLTTETRISEQGTILFPLIGEVALAGQTAVNAATRIAERLKQGNFLKNPQVTVSVTQVRSRQVSVLGQVGRPGRYVLDETGLKLTDILALAGGITPAGDNIVTVMTTQGGEPKKLEINVPALYHDGDLSSNIELQNGDTIYVPRAPVFYIYGEVQRPGSYRLEPNMVAMQALSAGGGLTPRGTERGLTIHRRMPDGTLRKLNARLLEPIQPDDVIYVRESWF